MIFELALILATVGIPSAGSPIDTLIAEAQAKAGVQPAPLCDNDTYIRRVTLDIAGRIPTVEELEAFRAHPDRPALVDRLLLDPGFPRFWSECWTAAAVGYGNTFGTDRELLRQWFEQQIAADVPYDQIVDQLLTAEGNSATNGPVNFLLRYPEEPATKVCRLFLGVRLECARCHDHPFDRWTREDFDAMNRFFAVVRREEVSEGNIRVRDELAEVAEEERPRFLTGATPRTRRWRAELSYYLTHSKPFARAFVNRLWYHFLGRGIVHPVDDFQRENPPSIPELLEYLRQRAVAEQFRLRPLIREICLSHAYQRDSAGNSLTRVEERLFVRYPLKPLTPEQTFDSALIALGGRPNPVVRRAFLRAMAGENLDEDFSATWEYRETVQDLMRKLAHRQPVANYPTAVWFRRALSREPTDGELRACRGKRSEDIAFALLLGAEFAFNH